MLVFAPDGPEPPRPVVGFHEPDDASDWGMKGDFRVIARENIPAGAFVVVGWWAKDRRAGKTSPVPIRLARDGDTAARWSCGFPLNADETARVWVNTPETGLTMYRVEGPEPDNRAI